MAFEVGCILEAEDYPFDGHSCLFQIKSCKSSPRVKVPSEMTCYHLPDYHDHHSITCTSHLRTPQQSGVKDIKALQHFVSWDSLADQDKVISISSGK